MREQKSGRIISVASGIGHYGMRQFSHYAASKAAIMGFVKSLAREVGPDGITVNAICPGSANTSMPRQHRSEEEVMERLQADAAAAYPRTRRHRRLDRVSRQRRREVHHRAVV